jgi:ABC transport system ATP-binding/permease protein
MPLLTLRDAELAFGLAPLLDRCQCVIEPGERIGLIGRNGTGKSTLLGVIAGRVSLDSGEYSLQGGLKVVTVEQEPILPEADTLHASLEIRGGLDDMDDDRARWRCQARLAAELDRFGLNVESPLANASGGERKRAALALAFALEPNLLLLDEPTNHLDVGAIEVLEARLREVPACVVVTHDRRFLDAVSTRILELDRGRLRSYPGSFTAYVERKEQELADEAVSQAKFDARLSEEEVWIRQGVKARRTRNEGRVRRLEALRQERAERRERIGRVKLEVDSGERSGRLVAELEGVSKTFGERTVIRGLDFRLMRGDRLGLIGPNGAGKSTLIRLLLGEMQPDTGEVRLGTKLQVAYFDQLREALDLERSVADSISPGADWVEVGGKRKHVMSYLSDFLFSPQRARTPVKALSGGERNRLLLARLFARPANLLVLDEPTNDLDLDTLELLESLLADYEGTLILVSHDRSFLDNVVTQSLVAQGDGIWREFVGGYSDWFAWRAEQAAAAAAPPAPAAAVAARPKPANAARLSFKETRELEALPAAIEALEKEQQTLAARMQQGLGNGADAAQTARQISERLLAIESELEQKLERWTALEARRG